MSGYIVLGFAALAVLFTLYHVYKPLPEGLSFDGQAHPSKVRFLQDASWIDTAGKRQIEQDIFDEVLRLINGAEQFILVDMFLYNDFQGPKPETTRALSGELTAALIAKKQSQPNIHITVISDSLNTLYGGHVSEHFTALREAGIPVVLTNLPKLRDSNPAYTFVWRLLLRPFGNSPGRTVPNPIGGGKVTVRSYLALANFKANHRKILLADDAGRMTGLVMSANPHDGSSAHRNQAVTFDGHAAADLLASENAVLKMSGYAPLAMDIAPSENADTQARLVTEGKIEAAVLLAINAAGEGDRLDLMMFYLSRRTLVKALKSAKSRGADVRVILDVNKDAFGRKKNGVPNRPVARELVKSGASVRWCHTLGEQCHNKMIMLERANGERMFISGSANYTRRNLKDLNLETNLVVTGPAEAEFFQDASAAFETAWNNTDGRSFTLPYDAFDNHPWYHRLQYRVMEKTGLSTF